MYTHVHPPNTHSTCAHGHLAQDSSDKGMSGKHQPHTPCIWGSREDLDRVCKSICYLGRWGLVVLFYFGRMLYIFHHHHQNHQISAGTSFWERRKEKGAPPPRPALSPSAGFTPSISLPFFPLVTALIQEEKSRLREAKSLLRHAGLPDSANKNTGGPPVFGIQIISEKLSISTSLRCLGLAHMKELCVVYLKLRF